MQQNNGNNNVIGAAMGLIANIFDGDSSHTNAVGTTSIDATVMDSKAYGSGGTFIIQQNTGNITGMGSAISLDVNGPAVSFSKTN